jgi:hypothetical protein
VEYGDRPVAVSEETRAVEAEQRLATLERPESSSERNQRIRQDDRERERYRPHFRPDGSPPSPSV